MRHGFSGGFSRITKPLHGLVLLFLFHSYGRGFFVLNPCTNALLTLPDTKYPLNNNRHLGTNLSGKYRLPGYMYWLYGLGYCSATGEYKVVRLFSLPYDPEAAATFCEVFVLDAPAYWRPTAQQPPAPADHNVKVMVTDPPVFLNGLFYFLCRDGLDVITLDVGDETFGSPPPLPVANMALDRNSKLTLTELDGCLCSYYREACSMRSYVLWLLRDGDHEAARWEQLCRVDTEAWPDPPWSIAPLTMLDGSGDGEKKIIFKTDKCVVLGVDLNGSGTSATPPEILLNPEDAVATAAETHLSPETTTATCRFRSEYPPELSLFEESLVPLGRTLEEIVFSSPATRAWSEVLKLLPARTVSDLSLVCREWRAMVTTNRFIRSHAVHSNLIATHPRIKLVVDTPRDYLDASGFADLDDLIISGNRPRMCTSTSFICCHAMGSTWGPSVGRTTCSTPAPVTKLSYALLTTTTTTECSTASWRSATTRRPARTWRSISTAGTSRRGPTSCGAGHSSSVATRYGSLQNLRRGPRTWRCRGPMLTGKSTGWWTVNSGRSRAPPPRRRASSWCSTWKLASSRSSKAHHAVSHGSISVLSDPPGERDPKKYKKGSFETNTKD